MEKKPTDILKIENGKHGAKAAENAREMTRKIYEKIRKNGGGTQYKIVSERPAKPEEVAKIEEEAKARSAKKKKK